MPFLAPQKLVEVQKLLQECSSAVGVDLPLGAIEELEGRDGVIHHHGSGQVQEIRKELERKRLMSVRWTETTHPLLFFASNKERGQPE